MAPSGAVDLRPRSGPIHTSVEYRIAAKDTDAFLRIMAERKRELIDTGNDKRYVRRDEQGRFDEVEDKGRADAQDRKRDAENTTTSGQGDRGDRKS